MIFEYTCMYEFHERGAVPALVVNARRNGVWHAAGERHSTEGGGTETHTRTRRNIARHVTKAAAMMTMATFILHASTCRR